MTANLFRIGAQYWVRLDAVVSLRLDMSVIDPDETDGISIGIPSGSLYVSEKDAETLGYASIRAMFEHLLLEMSS